MNELKENNDDDKMSIIPFFATPIMQVELDFDLEKLTEFAFEMWNKNKSGAQKTNRGGWQSNDITNEKHEEFIRLKKEINQYLQIYQSEVFRGMVFKEKIIHTLANMWVNINKKHHYNEWHIHAFATLSGTYYIKHDGSKENGNIIFKHTKGHLNSTYMTICHWPEGLVENFNEVSAENVEFLPQANTLFIFPSWLEHKVEINLKNNSRISLSFNSEPILEK